MQSLETALFDAVAEARMIERGISTSVGTEGLHQRLLALVRALRAASVADVEAILDTQRGVITRLKFKVKELARTEPRMARHHDLIFTNLLGLDSRQVPREITRLFEEVLKGVTYFQSEQSTASPIYHRLFSCGPGDNAFRTAFHQCSTGMTKADKKRRQKRIRTCFLERLIYDELYKQECLHFPEKGCDPMAQDRQHLFRLDLTRSDFQSCFPDRDMQVALHYEDGLPLRLEVTHIKHGQVDYAETFQRSFHFGRAGNKVYDMDVECTKRAADGTYFKVQRYAKPATYRRVP